MELRQPVTLLSNQDDPQGLPRLLAGEEQACRGLPRSARRTASLPRHHQDWAKLSRVSPSMR